jgi:hypothetical protein
MQASKNDSGQSFNSENLQQQINNFGVADSANDPHHNQTSANNQPIIEEIVEQEEDKKDNLDESATIRDVLNSAIAKTRKPYSKKLNKRIIKITTYLKNMPQGVRVSSRNLLSEPRILHLNPPVPKNAFTLKATYDHLDHSLKPHARYLALISMLLNFITHHEDEHLKVVFDMNLAQNGNPDARALYHHIKTNNQQRFAISQVNHPTYKRLGNPSNLVSFNILRVVAAKKDLLDILLTSFDSFCKHRMITSGWEVCDAGYPPSAISELRNEQQWHPLYAPQNKPKNVKTIPGKTSENDNDVIYTLNQVLPDNINEIYLRHGISKNNQNDEYSSPMLEYMDEAKFNHHTLKAASDDTTSKACHYFPCFRSLCVSFKGAKPSMLQCAENGCCRIMSNSVHRIISLYKESLHPATNIEKLASIIELGKATFTTNVTITFRYDPSKNVVPNNPRNLLPFKEEVLFEALDRHSHHYQYLKNTPVKEIKRYMTNPYINEESFNLAELIHQDDEVTSRVLQDYLDNDCFLNIDASLALFNLRREDRYEVKFTWRAIEGPRDYVTAYLIASTLSKKTDYAFGEEIKKLISKAQHDKNKDAEFILYECFPEFML